MQSNSWAQPFTTEILNYYPAQQQKKYGLYSPGLDRFLLTDSLDLFTLHHAACLLSSKIATVLCVFPAETAFGTENCLTWTLQNKLHLKKQTPAVHTVKSAADIIPAVPPAEMGDLLREQEFAAFVLRATYALRLADLVVSSHPESRNEDQNFYLDFFNGLSNPELQAAPDKTRWRGGFKTEVGSILYKADDIPEALLGFSELRNRTTDLRQDSNLQHMAQQLRAAYLRSFFGFLGWQP